MDKNQNIRILLTAAVLLIGGYYIQNSASTEVAVSGVVDAAHADVIIVGGGK